jgi:hypothetical protein
VVSLDRALVTKQLVRCISPREHLPAHRAMLKYVLLLAAIATWANVDQGVSRRIAVNPPDEASVKVVPEGAADGK